MGHIGEYTLKLYCDQIGCDNRAGNDNRTHVAEFCGDDRSDCVKQARRAGWTLNRRAIVPNGAAGFGRALCPLHARKK